MAARKVVDWEGVERDYSIGILTLREIAAKYDVSHQAIDKKAKKIGWTRDLSKKIAAEAEKLVDRALVDKLVDSKKKSEKEIIEVNAQAVVDIKLSHRKDISKGRKLVAMLFDELESTTIDRESYEKLGELMRSEDDNANDKLNDIYKKVIALPSRIDGVKKLSDALRVLVDKEREAFNIVGAATPTDNAIAGLLKGLQGNSLTAHTKIDIDDDDE